MSSETQERGLPTDPETAVRGSGRRSEKGEFLRRLGETWADDEKREEWIAKQMGRVRKFLLWLSVAYLAGIFVLWWLMAWVGERNLTFAFGLYLPRTIWLLPLPFLMFVTLLFRQWRVILLQLLIPAVVFWPLMGWEFGGGNGIITSSDRREESTLTVLTYNRGQHSNQSLQPFKNLVRPDIVVLQDAKGRARKYADAEGYEEFGFTKDAGEFTVLSRFPIGEVRQIEFEDAKEVRELAARFEIDWNGKPVALYAVHFRSPRDILSYYRRGAFLYGLIGIPGTPLNAKRKANQEYWDNRIAQVQKLLGAVRSDPIPSIVAGDFNAPSGGYVHGLVTDQLGDAHLYAGTGYGFTYPGKTRNPLSLFGPWMRIDYIFYDSHWSAVGCLTEADRPSQHRALAATLKFDPDGE